MTRKPRLVVLPPQHLGHEIHVGRSIVVDMLCKNALSPQEGDCVMTGLSDRKFLYESLFDISHVFDFSMLPGIQLPITPPKTASEYFNIPSSLFKEMDIFKDFQIINLSQYALPPTYCTFETSDEMKEVGYSVPDFYWTEKYLQLAKDFNFSAHNDILKVVPDSIPIYIMIHHRYSASSDNLIKLLISLPLDLPKIIFTSNISELKNRLRGLPNLFFTDDLKVYASLLKDERCKLLISEWSGAGQVGQYTLGPQGGIWFYYDHYPDIFNFTRTHKIWEHNSKLGNYFNCWDFKCVSGCSIHHFESIEKLTLATRNINII